MNADPVIELFPGADKQAFALMMVELLRTNLRDHPTKRRDFDAMNGRVTLVAEDIDGAVTLRFERGRLGVFAGVHGIPDLVVRGPSSSLIDLSRLPPDARVGFLPDLRSEVARALGGALRRGELKLYGALANLPLALRLAKVLSIY